MQTQQLGHSEALENLVERIPVKERENLSQMQVVYEKPRASISRRIHNVRLDMEIALYWGLSKYQQARRKKNPKTPPELD